MYAKLVFPYGTEYTLVARDIVRAITNSDGAGGSTVGALENVNAGMSTIVDTEAAGWSLVGSTLTTGASVEADKDRYLQQAHANGELKTVAIQTCYRDASGFTKANDTTYSGVMLSAIHDYGLSYESRALTPAAAAPAAASTSPWSRITGEEVHIIARQGCLVICGKKSNYLPGWTITALIEHPETYETREGGRTRAGYVILRSSGRPDAWTGYQTTSKSQVIEATTTNVMGGAYGTAQFLQFVDCLYDYDTSSEIRHGHIMTSTNGTTPALPSNCDPGGSRYRTFIYRDTGNADGWDTTIHYSTDAEQFFFGAGSGVWAYSMHPGVIEAAGHFNRQDWNNTTGRPRDTSGNDLNVFTPAMFKTGQANNLFDLSDVLYTGNKIFAGDVKEFSFGGQDYLAVAPSDQSGRPGSYVFRK